MTEGLTMEAAALVAASQAAEATAELLRFAREGEQGTHGAFDNEPIEKLAEALKLAIDIDDPASRAHLDADEKALYAEMRSTCVRFLEGWAG